MRKQKSGPPSGFQVQLAARLGVVLPDGCDSNDAARTLDPVILRKSKDVMAANPALRKDAIIIHKGVPKKIVGIVDQFKLDLRPHPSGGKREMVWIIDAEDCQEASVED